MMWFRFEQLSFGLIKPKGWLLKQLTVQKEGLSGNLDRFWPDIKDSKWFGGNAEGWERAPYWLDGVIPLAYLLDDLEFRDNIRKKMDLIFSKQQDDGWPYPMTDQEKRNYDLWALLLISKVVYTYYMAEKDERCVRYLTRLFDAVDKAIDRTPLRHWAQYRWFEGVIPLLWLYDKTKEEKWLLLGRRLMAQGFRWDEFHRSPLVEAPAEKGRWSFDKHVVNNAMAIKANGIAYALIEDPYYLENLTIAKDRLDEFHGYVTGVFSGDEVLAGKSPVQGTELCAVAEYMYSLEVLIEMFGKGDLADRLEKITFNAWPATFLPDMWSHQYDQQINQAECSIKQGRTWKTNGPASNIFGLEPNYGCCTANLSQGWPKYAASLWMKTDDDGLAVISYAPCSLSTTLKDVQAEVIVDTQYPFKEDVTVLIKADKPVSFPLYIRVPKWCNRMTVTGVPFDKETVKEGFVKTEVRIGEEKSKEIRILLPSEITLYETPQKTVSVTKGPLVFSLPIEEEKIAVNTEDPLKAPPHGDFELYPVSEWRYALDPDTSKMTYEEKKVTDACMFAPENAPVALYVDAYYTEDWGMTNGSCDEKPGPVPKKRAPERIRLIPYGCTNLRITEFPVAEDV
jgi:hypothetical protein